MVNLKQEGLKPVLQIIEIKQVGGGGSMVANTRHRIIISDGQQYAQSMLATQLNPMVASGQLQVNCIISVQEYVVNDVQGKQIIIILACEVVSGPVPKIGEPVNLAQVQGGNTAPMQAPSGVKSEYQQQGSGHNPYQQGANTSYMQNNTGYMQNNSATPSNSYSSGPSNPYASAMRGGNQPVVRDDTGGENFQPISTLNPYQNRWTIKARVTKRGEIKRWCNSKGEGHLASVDLLDAQGGEIRASMFKEDCDRLYNILEEGKVFIISGGRLKVANKQYSTLKNDYEITFGNETTVKPVHSEDGSIQQNKYVFRKINELQTVEVGSTIDLVGIVKDSGTLAEIVSQKLGGKTLEKRDLLIVDQSNTEVRFTVWGEQAKAQNKWENNPVVAIKGAKVSDFGGVSLSGLQSTSITMNPMIPEGQQLRSWWDSYGSSAQATSLSGPGGGGGRSFTDKIQNRYTVAQLSLNNLGYNEKPDYAEIKATLSYMKHSPQPWYNSCPLEDCKKKVTQGFDNTWHCEKCNKSYPKCMNRYVMSTRFLDHTGQDWFSVFNEQGNELVGKTADELDSIKNEQGNEVLYEDAFARANFQQCILRVRIKAENYNDENRVKKSIMELKKVDYVQESQKLIAAINLYH